MFITPDQAKKITNVEVSTDLIYRSQMVIESYVGKIESEIKNGKDKLIMSRAVAYQSAYMKENENIVFQQVALDAAGAGNSYQNFDSSMSGPWISPLAVMVIKSLSFNNSKSFRTGRIFQKTPYYRSDWMRY
jgi:hypothetical protein